MAGFFGRVTHDDNHLKIKAAHKREEIVVESGFKIPEEKPQKANSRKDEWDTFWATVKLGDSFIVTESFSHTIKASASKRGIVTRMVSVGPFKVRMWRCSK